VEKQGNPPRDLSLLEGSNEEVPTLQGITNPWRVNINPTIK
jgi:hypothetical protein